MGAAMSLDLTGAPPDLRQAVREFWAEAEYENALSIAYLESGWKWYAIDDTTSPSAPCGTFLRKVEGVDVTAELSIGYFQINACNFPDWDPWKLMDPYQNAGTAHMLWDQAGQSWSPWYFSAKQLGLI
jgi:hypothetical protein